MQFKNYHSLPACAGALLALGCLLLSIPGPRTQRAHELGHPGPVEGDDEGGAEQAARRRWIEEMHRAAPGVDWRRIEKANQEAERLRRNGLAGAPEGAGGLSGAWFEVGSKNISGHTRCAAYGPERNGERLLYVGSANGGLWRGTMDGTDWTPLSEGLFGGFDGLVVVPPSSLNDADILITRQGSSIYRSDDQGSTWTVPSGLGGISDVRSLVVLPDGLSTVLIYGQWNGGNALLASIDLGQTFSVRKTWPTPWSGELWVPQVGNGAGTDIWLYHNNKIRVSLDGGFQFTVRDGPGGASQGHLTGSEAGGGALYLTSREGNSWVPYRSLDGGWTFNAMAAPPEYWGSQNSMVGFSSNRDALVLGGTNGYTSSNGGQTWEQISSWGEYYGNPAQRLHADLRAINVLPHPDGPAFGDIVYFNTDGGTYRSTDEGQSVENLSLLGLGVGQFYSTLTDSNSPNRIHGGTQDQGYQIGMRAHSTGTGPSTGFSQIISGDYGHLTSPDGSLDRVYSTYPGFTLIASGPTSSLSTLDFPQGSSHLWLPPVVADPGTPNSFFFLGRYLWRQYRTGASWSEVHHSTRDFGAGSGSYLSAMAFSPTDPDLAWAANNAGRLWWSTDRGVTWTEGSVGIPGSHYFYGNCIAPHPTDPNRIAASGTGYSTPGVRLSVDGGQSWQGLAQGLPQTMVFGVAWSADGSDDLYAATEAGAWHMDAATQVWSNAMGTQAPATTYWSIETVPAQGIMRFGTYGRGIWDLVLSSTPGLGERFCSPAGMNSTGTSASLIAAGSLDPNLNDLSLTAQNLPLNRFGYLLCSRNEDWNVLPGGSNGILCMGTPIGRFIQNVMHSGTSGSFTHQVDLTQMPMQPVVAVLPGETWNFQAWYRDLLLLPTSNFTEALRITFQ
ncbi:MAG TPA: hypothetical protein EYQ25_13340 [Planctomycetes bacterium]|nr:hypothetical protein [Planctomycetota bacterium]HIL38599.1 hypothetical protein [Planctomycetota bacterium]